MASLGIDGLVSGLDTTSLITSLMTIEQQPQTLLKNTVTTTQSFISSLQTINGQIQNLATKATEAAKGTSLNLFTATSSAASVTATTSATASQGSLAFTVDSIAAAQVGVTAAMSAWSADAAPALTIVGADGTRTAITAKSGSLDDVASAINASTAGIKAVKVAAGTDAAGAKLYRLQISATTTGAAGAFSVYQGSTADVDAGTATNVLTQSGAAVVTAASDASVTLWAGTAAEQTITSTTNAFTDLLPGVDVTVSAPSADPVTVAVGRDVAGATSAASALVTQMNAITSYYATATAVTTSTDASTGQTTTLSGTLTGDATSRDVVQRLTAAMSTPVNGMSPSSIGISITKDGDFEFDEERFQAALAADPDAVQTMFAAVAQNVATAATAASDKYTGSITTAITGQQTVVTDLSKRISDWDIRLAARKASLQLVYTNLETSLSTLKSQSDWMTSQLSTLTTSS